MFKCILRLIVIFHSIKILGYSKMKTVDGLSELRTRYLKVPVRGDEFIVRKIVKKTHSYV